MENRDKFKFTTMLIITALIPILIYSLAILAGYKKYAINNNFKALETIRDEKLERIRYSYEQLFSKLRTISFFEGEKLIDNNVNVTYLMKTTPELENIFIYDGNFKIVNRYKRDESMEKIFANRLKYIQFYSFYYFENLDSIKDNVFQIVYVPIKDRGFAVFLLNNHILKRVVKGNPKYLVDIYSDRYLTLASSYRRDISSDGITKKMQQVSKGKEKNEIYNGKLLSYSFVDFETSFIYLAIENRESFIKSFNHKFFKYIALVVILTISITILISWKMFDFITTHQSMREFTYNFDSFLIKKLESDIKKSANSINNILENYRDFQVLKDDLDETIESLSKRSLEKKRDDDDAKIDHPKTKKDN